jgi:stress response protein YsnF
VERGGVRVHSRIVEKPVEKTIRLREEHVYVERNKVDKPVTDADLNEFKEGTIDVREHAEVPVVTKETNVVEEVSVNKTVGEREETIRDNVRRKEVDVEDVDTGRKNTNS